MMNLFKRKETIMGKPQVTGTYAMRALLKQRSQKWNLNNVARDINDAVTQDSKRGAALSIARRPAGDGATDSVTASIAKSLAGTLSGDSVEREAGVTGGELEDSWPARST
jgi:hypothetical protein